LTASQQQPQQQQQQLLEINPMKRQPEQAEVSVKSKRKSPTKKQGQFSSTKKRKFYHSGMSITPLYFI
jgi:hypothetical protein